MKILLANKFYYRRGGDCIYMLNLEKLLKAHGHEVAVFAKDYPEKTVLGANIGGIPELIVEGGKSAATMVPNGMTFTSGDVEDLKDKIEKMFAYDFDYQAIAKDAIERYSSEAYYHKLMEYYK